MSDRVEPHVAEGTAPDGVGARDTLVCIHPRESAIFQQDIFAEIGRNHTLARAITDVIHTAVGQVKIHHIVGV